MDPARIAELLQPFLAQAQPAHLEYISTYIDILLRWNARINLTAVRQPEEIITRHFGESLFAARHLFPAADHVGTAAPGCLSPRSGGPRVLDIGSGAGFPGLPLKIWAPQIHLTLIESNHKKATFLREVIRSLTLTNVDVFAARAEDFPTATADLVTLRAVEHFDAAIPTAARLVAPAGRLALLIGQAKVHRAQELTPSFTWAAAVPIPLSSSRVLLVGIRES